MCNLISIGIKGVMFALLDGNITFPILLLSRVLSYGGFDILMCDRRFFLNPLTSPTTNKSQPETRIPAKALNTNQRHRRQSMQFGRSCRIKS